MTVPPPALDPLRRAVATLREALALPVDPIVRDATIQRFEYTYELAWKALRRVMRDAYGLGDDVTRRGLFREAGRRGLVDDVPAWFAFNDARDLTSHTYDEATAARVYAAARGFVGAVESLVVRLEAVVRDAG